MKKIRLFLVAAVLLAAGSAFTTDQGGLRYFRNGQEIFDTSPCILPDSELCYVVYDETGTEKIEEVYGTWTGPEQK